MTDPYDMSDIDDEPKLVIETSAKVTVDLKKLAAWFARLNNLEQCRFFELVNEGLREVGGFRRDMQISYMAQEIVKSEGAAEFFDSVAGFLDIERHEVEDND